jgi:hypothetical protein
MRRTSTARRWVLQELSRIDQRRDVLKQQHSSREAHSPDRNPEERRP